jgi:peptidoglycan hydrolase-like protein with peptidoglycan-binding domain
VKGQFDRVYGNGPVERDATGRQRDPKPKPDYASGRLGLDPFRPAPRPETLHPHAPVGRAAKPQRAGAAVNARRDVIGIQKALAGTGWYDWRPPAEPSGEVTQALDAAIRAFQQANGLKIDGLIDPNGPTVRSLAKAAGMPLSADGDSPGTRPDHTPPDQPAEPPAPERVPLPDEGEGNVPPEGYLTECQKLYFSWENSAERLEAKRRLIDGLRASRNHLVEKLSVVEAAIRHKEIAEGKGGGLPPSPGSSSKSFALDVLEAIIREWATRKRQSEFNFREYFDTDLWAPSSDQLKHIADRIRSEVAALAEEIETVTVEAEDLVTEVGSSKARYMERCGKKKPG